MGSVNPNDNPIVAKKVPVGVPDTKSIITSSPDIMAEIIPQVCIVLTFLVYYLFFVVAVVPYCIDVIDIFKLMLTFCSSANF